MAINKERLAKGIEALRSGEFKQGSGALRDVVTVTTEDGDTQVARYCCLGVLTMVALRDGCENVRFTEGTEEDPLAAGKWYEVRVSEKDRTCACCYTEDGFEPGGNGVLVQQVADYYGFDEFDPELTDPQGYEPVDGTKCTATTLNDRLNRDFETIALAFENTYLKGE